MYNNEIFYKYYDILFADKGYSKEIEDVIRLAERYGKKKGGDFLEIGCGTGNHTIELSKQCDSLVSLDIDAQMIEKAKVKIKDNDLTNVQLNYGGVGGLHCSGFSLAVALFNVVTYIPDSWQLLQFFKGVRERLDNKGIFVFDCWNGIATILDPALPKETIKYCDENRVICSVKPDTDVINQVTNLTYHITAKNKDGETMEEGEYILHQYLWTPQQIKFAAELGGLEVLHCDSITSPGKGVDQSDRKIMFVCVKNE